MSITSLFYKYNLKNFFLKIRYFKYQIDLSSRTKSLNYICNLSSTSNIVFNIENSKQKKKKIRFDSIFGRTKLLQQLFSILGKFFHFSKTVNPSTTQFINDLSLVKWKSGSTVHSGAKIEKIATRMQSTILFQYFSLNSQICMIVPLGLYCSLLCLKDPVTIEK